MHDSQHERNFLQVQLDKVEEEKNEIQKRLAITTQERNSLENQVAELQDLNRYGLISVQYCAINLFYWPRLHRFLPQKLSDQSIKSHNRYFGSVARAFPRVALVNVFSSSFYFQEPSAATFLELVFSQSFGAFFDRNQQDYYNILFEKRYQNGKRRGRFEHLVKTLLSWNFFSRDHVKLEDGYHTLRIKVGLSLFEVILVLAFFLDFLDSNHQRPERKNKQWLRRESFECRK